jgi:hypothetical protein
MDAGAVIVEAHAELERLFAAYEGIDGSPAARRRTFGVIAGALGVHAAIAGELLYPALQAQTSRYDGDIRRQLEQAHVLDCWRPSWPRRSPPTRATTPRCRSCSRCSGCTCGTRRR